jgi:hypothetical protein
VSPRRSRSRGSSGGFGRRSVLAGLGSVLVAGGAASSFGSGAFTSTVVSRTTNVSVVSDKDAFVGLEVYTPVKKNEREPLVTIANNTVGDASVTVSLTDCTQGTLYDSEGNSACSVTFPIVADGSSTVEIEAAETGTIPFDIEVDSEGFSLQATRETEAESGNVKGAVRIKYVDKFKANAQGSNDDWSIKEVKVADEDGDADLASVEYEITDSDGTIRATRTDSASGAEYKVKNVTIQPDDSSYQLQTGEQYTLTVTAYDEDGNYDTQTETDTA